MTWLVLSRIRPLPQRELSRNFVDCSKKAFFFWIIMAEYYKGVRMNVCPLTVIVPWGRVPLVVATFAAAEDDC